MAIGVRWGAVLIIGLCAGAGFAQQKAVPAQAADPGRAAGAAPGSTTGGISLDVVVTPKSGKPIAGLTEQEFTVLDNKVPQKITSFRALGGGAGAVEMILVIDSVNTTYTSVAYERSEIDRFFAVNGGHLAFPTQLAIFSDTGTQIQQGFSKSGTDLSASLARYTVALRSIQRSAGFYGAAERLQLSIKTLEQMASYGATLPGRKLMVWISPGWPILSGPAVEMTKNEQQALFQTIMRVSDELRRARVTVYSVDPLGTQDVGFQTYYYQSFMKGIRKPNQTQFGNVALQVIATQTGGLVMNSSNDVAAELQRAVDDASSYYQLSFDPVPGEPDEYHQIEIKVDKPGLAARTRTLYYSQR